MTTAGAGVSTTVLMWVLKPMVKASFSNGIGIGGYEGVNATAETALPTQISSGVDYSLNERLDSVSVKSPGPNYSSIDKIKFKGDGLAVKRDQH